MKKVLLTITAIVASIAGVMAQDLGMETWANVPLSTTVQDPTGWASFNALTLTGMAQSVFKVTTPAADVYAGTASAKVTTQNVGGSASVPNPFRPGQNFGNAGILGMGTTSLTAPYIKYGQPLPAGVSRPAQLSFACKYTPMGTDSAFVVAFLTHWAGNHRDTVAKGKFFTNATSTSYTLNNITMVYNPLFSAVLPDTQQVYASSSSYLTNGVIGSAFYVDAFAWSGYNSINEINGVTNTVSVFPNPASTEVNLSCSTIASWVEVADIAGRKVGLFVMQDNKVKIQTAGFANGLYMYNVLNEKKEVINRGKFEVTK